MTKPPRHFLSQIDRVLSLIKKSGFKEPPFERDPTEPIIAHERLLHHTQRRQLYTNLFVQKDDIFQRKSRSHTKFISHGSSPTGAIIDRLREQDMECVRGRLCRKENLIYVVGVDVSATRIRSRKFPRQDPSVPIRRAGRRRVVQWRFLSNYSSACHLPTLPADRVRKGRQEARYAIEGGRSILHTATSQRRAV